jgi:hypothetical protein
MTISGLLGRKHGCGIKSAVANLRNVVWLSRAGWKYLASKFNDDWTIDDYPIRYRFQPAVESPKTSRLRPIPWVASVINWPAMSGNGSTKHEAIQELREKFDRFKATHEKLPRPGTKVPIEFVKTNRVDQHSELAKDFIRRVLEIEWAWISDESSLWDFHGDETNGKLNDKIRQIYGVDVSDISSGNLAQILEKISKSSARENLR